MMRPLTLAIALLCVSTMSATKTRAQNPSADKSAITSNVDRNNDLDKRIVKIVFDAASLGTEIYNKGNKEGCYRLYQGTLMAVYPLLKDYRDKLAASIKDKMDRSKVMNVEDGAFLLRAGLDEVQNTIAPGQQGDSLWKRMGGPLTMATIVEQVLKIAVDDPKVNLFRGKKFDQSAFNTLKDNMYDYISSKTGGLVPYKGKDMKAAHAGMKITDDEFNALMTIFSDVLKKNKISDSDAKEFLKMLEETRKDIVEAKK